MLSPKEVTRNVFRENLWIPITHSQAIYVRGVLRRAVKNLKDGDERDYVRQFLDRLEQDCENEAAYFRDLPF